MTSQFIVCPACGSETPRGEGSCVSCGETLPAADVTTPEDDFAVLTLDGPSGGTRRLPVLSEAEAHLADGPEASFEPLLLQPNDGTRVTQWRPMQSAIIVALVIAAVAWAVAEWRIATTDEWGIWEPIWYVAALATIVLGALAAVLVWRMLRAGRR